jgi:NADH dehydrogenase
VAQVEGRFTAVVVGAGFTGLELACELVDRLRAIAAVLGAAAEVRVVLVEREETVGPELGEGPRPHIRRALDELGIEVRVGVALESVIAAGVRLTDGTQIATRTAVLIAGMAASPPPRRSPERAIDSIDCGSTSISASSVCPTYTPRATPPPR